MGPDGSERRQNKRIHKHFILTYFDRNSPGKRFEASQLKNLSLGGMCLITAKPFAEGTKLGIELKTPFISELIHLEGTVLGSQEKLKGVIYETRMEFGPLKPETELLLKKIVHYFENEPEGHHE